MPDEQTDTDEQTDQTEDANEEQSSDELAAGGHKALQAERRARRAAEKSVTEMRAQLDTLRNANQTETERAIETARKEAWTEATKASNGRVLRSELIAKAAARLVDPTIAPQLIDLDQFTVGDDGTVNDKELSSAIDELLREKPYLAATAGRAPDLKQGRRGDGSTEDANEWLRGRLSSRH